MTKAIKFFRQNGAAWLRLRTSILKYKEDLIVLEPKGL